MNKRLEQFFAIGMLLFAVGFNLWLYRLEPTSLVDPNDNAFQYALVDRTNQIWDFAIKSCTSQKQDESRVKKVLVLPVSLLTCFAPLLTDHWVPNWAEGYNLPFYYSHIPQIAIVVSYRFLSFFSQFSIFNFQFLMKISNFKFQISLFQYYHLVIYLLMCLFPLSVFLALRVIKLPWLAAGIGAVLGSQISTDGLYGLDPPSFLFRGWGLSSQLFAMIWLPLAIAYAWRFFTNYELRSMNNGKKLSFILPIFFLVATTMGHVGIGYIALLSLIPLAFAKPIISLLQSHDFSTFWGVTKNELTKLLLLVAVTIFFLSYWIIPIVLTNDYHNLSFWDPVWKFDSWGWRLTMDRLLNGELFDWGRFPVMTLLVFVGIFASLLPSNNITIQQFNNRRNADGENRFSYFPFALLFIFWLLLYFGRATWGSVIDLIPGMAEFHISRFIVGLHLTGLFLIPIGIEKIATVLISAIDRLKTVRLFHSFISLFSYSLILLFAYSFILLFAYFALFPQTIRYATHNDFLIRRANEDYKKIEPDLDVLFTTLKELQEEKPGRIYAGRGGNWGKDFKVAETTYFMHLSTYGLPVVLWLPETWSPNSDIEQYFNDEYPSHFALFGIRYIVAPPEIAPKSFWKFLKETPTWKLYEISPTGDAVEGIPRDAQPSSMEPSLMEAKERNASIAGEGNRGRTRLNIFGYFTSGVRPAIVSSSKLNYINVVRRWIQSDAHEKGLYPELTFAKDFPRKTGLPNFRMFDEVTYQVPNSSTHNIFAEPPVYMAPGQEVSNTTNTTNTTNTPIIRSEEEQSDMIFKAHVEVPEDCTECIVILKQSSHPNWRVRIDEKGVQPLTVFPFFLAVPVSAGTHEIVFFYKPSRLKIVLLSFEILAIGGITIILFSKRLKT